MGEESPSKLEQKKQVSLNLNDSFLLFFPLFTSNVRSCVHLESTSLKGDKGHKDITAKQFTQGRQTV